MEGSWALMNKKQRLKVSCRDQRLDSVLTSSSASNCFPVLRENSVSGSRSILNFGAFNGTTHSFSLEEIGNDYLDEYLNYQPEKKRRLSMDQVKSLEKNFVKDNRLEPERKIHLAKELNLEPRQIAIWFQNRRARSRTNQLEIDYETLHESYVNLKNNYDNLVKENEKLKSEILCLRHDDSASDVERSSSNLQSPMMPQEGIGGKIFVEDEIGSNELAVAKSDVTTEVEVPLMTFDEIQYCHLESNDSSRVIELDQSDVWQNGEGEFQLESLNDNISKSEDGFCHASSDYSFYYGIQVEERPQAMNFWSYN